MSQPRQRERKRLLRLKGAFLGLQQTEINLNPKSWLSRRPSHIGGGC